MGNMIFNKRVEERLTGQSDDKTEFMTGVSLIGLLDAENIPAAQCYLATSYAHEPKLRRTSKVFVRARLAESSIQFFRNATPNQ